MNTKLSICLAALLLIAGVTIAFKTSYNTVKKSSENQPSIEKKDHSRSARNQPNLSAGSFRFLQSVPDLDLNSPPTFSSIEDRTKHLTIAQIEDLLDKHTSHEGLTGWLRSALWAELGRRNHRPTIDALLTRLQNEESNRANFPDDQAIFAFLRGRTETLTEFDDNLDSVLEDFNNFAGARKSGYWRSPAVTRLFSQLTRIDPEAAWDLAHKNSLSENLHDNMPGLVDNSLVSSLTGFFQGLPSEELASSYLKKWQSALETPEAKKAYDTYQQQLNSRLSGFIAIPPEESIVTQAVASLARFNPEIAVAWLKEHEPNPEKPDYNRTHGMWRQLATNYPEQALEIFSREEYLDPRRANIGWMIQYNHSLLPDVIAETDKSSHQVQIIQSVLMSSGSNHVKDFFPTPDGPNRLPNFQQRRDYILEAIELGTYHEKQKESLIRSLNREFQHKLGKQ